jgi:hypothetical protein
MIILNKSYIILESPDIKIIFMNFLFKRSSI